MRRSRKAFTLIEMIVATLLLGIGIVGAMGAFIVSTGASGQAEKAQKAALLAQGRLTDLELHPETLGGGGDTSGAFSDDDPEFRYTQHVETGEFPNLYKVTIVATWGDPNMPHEREFTTYMRDDQNQPDTNPDTTGTTTGASTGAGGATGGQ